MAKIKNSITSTREKSAALKGSSTGSKASGSSSSSSSKSSGSSGSKASTSGAAKTSSSSKTTTTAKPASTTTASGFVVPVKSTTGTTSKTSTTTPKTTTVKDVRTSGVLQQAASTPGVVKPTTTATAASKSSTSSGSSGSSGTAKTTASTGSSSTSKYVKYNGGNAELDKLLAEQSKKYMEARERALSGDKAAVRDMRNANDRANQLRNQYGYAAELANDDIENVKAQINYYTDDLQNELFSAYSITQEKDVLQDALNSMKKYTTPTTSQSASKSAASTTPAATATTGTAGTLTMGGQGVTSPTVYTSVTETASKDPISGVYLPAADGSASAGTSAGTTSGDGTAASTAPTVNDYSQYIEEMNKAQEEAALAELRAAYEKNLAGLDRTQAGLSPTYDAARNQAAGQAELARQQFNEFAAANGLNSGAGGQAQLAMNNALQGSLSELSAQEAQSLADLELQRSQAEIDYNAAIAQAQASGDYQLAQQLYQEKVRVDEATREALAQQAQQDYQAAILQFQKDQWAAELEQLAVDNAYRDQYFQFQQDEAAADRSYQDQVFQYQQSQDALDRDYQNQLFAYQQSQDAADRAYNDSLLQYQQEQAAADRAYQNEVFQYQQSQDALDREYQDQVFQAQQEQQAWQNAMSEDAARQEADMAEWEQIYTLAQQLAAQGDFSGYAALGLDTTQMQANYNAQLLNASQAGQAEAWQQEWENALELAESMAKYGDFSGYAALGVDPSAMWQVYQAKQTGSSSSGGGGSSSGSSSGSGNKALTYAQAIARAEEGDFSDPVRSALAGYGFDDAYLAQYYGYQPGGSGGNAGSVSGGTITSFNQLGAAAQAIANGMSRANSGTLAAGFGDRIQSALNAGSITEAEADYLMRMMGY